MRILEAEPPPEPNPWLRRIVVGFIVLLAMGTLVWWQFLRYREEKQVVERFMEALKAGEYRQAYRIWGPTETYTFKEFMIDWGPTTPRGEVRTYEIVDVQEPGESLLLIPGRDDEDRRTIGVDISRGASGVIVLVRVNNQKEAIRIWVEKEEHTLDFPPF